MKEWEEFGQKIESLKLDIHKFGVEFLNRDSFKELCNRLYFDMRGYKEICITGYFSEAIREELQKLQKTQAHLRLICPEFPLKSPRDRKNIEALTKLVESGIEIKFNNRLHARMFIAYTTYKNSKPNGELILGSFDFNTECMGRERYDAGIRTRHPDLVESAIAFFDEVWQDSGSIKIEEFLGSKK